MRGRWVAPGFPKAGQPKVQWKQGASTVRSRGNINAQFLQPMAEGASGDMEAEHGANESEGQKGGDADEMETFNEK